MTGLLGVGSRSRLLLLAAVIVLGALATTAALKPGLAHATPTPMTALINGDSVTTNDGITDASGPISLEQFAAQHLGYTVTVVTGTQWDAMTQADFAKYQVLINGDPFCGTVPDSTTSNASTWAPVVMGTAGGNTQPGNRAVVSTDPEDHYADGDGGAKPTNPSDPSTAGAEHLVEAGIHFAGDGPAGTTGFYFDTTCSINAGTIPTLDMLTTTGPGNWVVNPSPPCGGSVQQIASTPEFSIVSDSDIQGWQCSDHETWPKFPADWNAQAVATDTPTHPTCGTDPSTATTACGEAYVLLAGTGSVVTSPDLSLSPTSATNPTGTDHTITATVTHDGSPEAGDTVTFAVASGPNTGAKGTCTFSAGSADPGCMTGSDGKVRFTYHDAGGAGTDTIDASVTLSSGSTEHASATKTWDPAITAHGTSVSATEGKSFTGTVATFSDPDSAATASDYSASINWGDGTTTSGTISGSPSQFTVSGSHTYAEEGSRTITVTITDTDNSSNSATASSTATVHDAALHASGVPPSSSGTTASGTVATFTDDDPNGTLSDYSASINWGDGTRTTGKVGKSGSRFTVSGSHTYAKAGTFTIKTTIKDKGGSTATATTTVASHVKAAKVSAKLSSVPIACVSNAFTARVSGTRIASVKFLLDGKRMSSRTVHRGRQYSARISVRPGRHTLTVRLTFKRGSAARFRTFRRTVLGCPAPTFTG